MKDEKTIVTKWYNKPAAFGFFIVVSSIAVYINSLGGDFIWDDIEQIVENPVIMDLSNVPYFFTSDLWRLIDNPTIGSYYYRPLFLLSLASDYSLWGLNPLGYHITNIMLHSLVSIMVYLIGRRLFRNNPAALVGSLIFAVHPVHVESVAWISGRTDPMAALFLLFSFHLYTLFKEDKNNILLFLSLAAYFLSLLSKEMAITLPLLLAAYEFSFHEKQPGERRIKSMWAICLYILVSIAYLYIRATILGEAIGGASSSSSPLYMRLYTSFGILLDYIRIVILPINLKVLYEIPLKVSFFDWNVLLPLLLLVSLLITTCIAYKRERILFFTGIWFFITILPISNIVPLKPTMMAERYLYVPSIGICLLAGLVSYKIYTKGHQISIYFTAFIVILISLLSSITFQRNRLWANETTYFTQSAKDAPDNAYAHHNLGDVYRKKGHMEKAIEEWRTAVRLYPLHAEANNSLANIALIQENYQEAVNRYRIALKGRPENSEAHYNLAMTLERLGNKEEAMFHYREFMRTASPKHQYIIEEIAARLKLFETGKEESLDKR